MIFDLEKIPALPKQHYDVCIVGAGAAGIILGISLARAKLNVVVLEGGGLTEERRSDELYSADVIGHPHSGIREGRRRIFGGTTTAWGGQILPLAAIDFEKRAWVPGSGWPIDYAMLQPYYERALLLEGLRDAIKSDDEVWRAVGVNPGDFATRFEAYFSRWCPEPNFARLYGNEIRTSSNLDVVLHANVFSLDIDHETGSIEKVRCRGYSGMETSVAADRFVLSLGGLETIRLLLQPPAAGGQYPWAAGGLVGRHFQDHLGCTIGRLPPGPHPHLHRIFDNVYKDGLKYHPRLTPTRTMQQDFELLNAAAFLSPRSKHNNSLASVKRVYRRLRSKGAEPFLPSDVISALGSGVFLTRQAFRLASEGRAYSPDDLGVDVQLSCEQLPLGDSKVSLSDDRDASGMRRIVLDWRINPVEIESMCKMGYALRDLFKARGWAELELDHDLCHDHQAFKAKVTDYYHHMGGVAMNTCQSKGVVDPDLRIFGTPNGYVCSAAVFPTSGFSNPTHTVLALAVRLSDHLLQRVSRGH